MQQNLQQRPFEEFKTEILQASEKQHELARDVFLEALRSEHTKMQEWLVQWSLSSLATREEQYGQVGTSRTSAKSAEGNAQKFDEVSESTTSSVTSSPARNGEEVHPISCMSGNSKCGHRQMTEDLEQLLASQSEWFSVAMTRCGVTSVYQIPESWLATLVTRDVFVNLVSVLIIANTIFIGVETNAAMTHCWEHPDWKPPRSFKIINLSFTVVFCLELILRCCALRWWFVFGDECKWNCFDLVLVSSAVVQELLETMSSLSFIRIIRIFRIVRIMRIIRVMRIFSELRRMVFAIGASLMSLAWAFSLLLIFVYVFAIFNMQGAVAYIEDHGRGDDTARKLNTLVGDLFKSMDTLIQCISGGVDWGDVSHTLGQQHVGYKHAFLAYIVFTVFGVLNVLTAVFTSRSAEFVDRDLLIQQEMNSKVKFFREMQSIFEDWIGKRRGSLSWAEFSLYMTNKRTQAYFDAQGLDTSDVRSLFQLMDTEGREEIRTLDFITGCFKLKGAASAMQVKKLSMEVHETLGTILKLCSKLAADPTKERTSSAQSPKNVCRNGFLPKEQLSKQHEGLHVKINDRVCGVERQQTNVSTGFVPSLLDL